MASFQHQTQNTARERGRGDLKCPYHGNVVVFKCHDCNELACMGCVTTIHNQHNLAEIRDIVRGAKQQITSYVNSAEKDEIPKVKAEIKKGEDNRSKNRQYYLNLITEIEKQRDISKSELDETAGELIKACRDMIRGVEDIFDKHKRDLQTMIYELNKQVKDCKEALQSQNTVLAFDVSKSIHSWNKDIPTTESQGLCNATNYSSLSEEEKKKWLKSLNTLETSGAMFMKNQQKFIEDLEQLRAIASQKRNQNADNFKESIRPLQKRFSEVTLKGHMQGQTPVYTQRQIDPVFRFCKTEKPSEITKTSDLSNHKTLTDKFDRLYDVAWSDALEVLQRRNKSTPQKNLTDDLLKIFEKCYFFCERLSSQQLTDIIELVLNPTANEVDMTIDVIEDDLSPEIGQELNKILHKTRKMTAETFLPYFHQFAAHDDSLRKYMSSRATEAYTKDCITLCWYCVIQDPPVTFLWDVPIGIFIDTNIFKIKGIGFAAEYMVWPAMLLHENGPVLSRGVVQAKTSPYGRK